MYDNQINETNQIWRSVWNMLPRGAFFEKKRSSGSQLNVDGYQTYVVRVMMR